VRRESPWRWGRDWSCGCCWRWRRGPQAYDCFHQFITSPLGSLLLLGWTVAIFLHMGNGIRHFFWDVGKGYSIPVAHRSAYLLIAFTTIMTLIVWFVGCPWQ
jgi:succinate dehydrogenase / fumarate reductase cytochrome b subunit